MARRPRRVRYLPRCPGGALHRPALHRLLADIAGHWVDIVVVYKVDRLTRSLADFARLVEIFDTGCFVRLGDPAIQHHKLDGPADPQFAAQH